MALSLGKAISEGRTKDQAFLLSRRGIIGVTPSTKDELCVAVKVNVGCNAWGLLDKIFHGINFRFGERTVADVALITRLFAGSAEASIIDAPIAVEINTIFFFI